MELEVCPVNSSLIRMVTNKSEFAREDVTHIFMDQNTAFGSKGGAGEIHERRGVYRIAHASICRGIEVQGGR